MAGLVGYAFTAGGVGASFAAFNLAAAVIILLMFGLSLVVVTAQAGVIFAIHAHAGDVKRLGGWILMVVGIWLLLLAVFAARFARVFPV